MQEDTHTGYIAHEVRNSLQVLLPLEALDRPMTGTSREELKRNIKLGVENMKAVFCNVLSDPNSKGKSAVAGPTNFKEQIQGLVVLHKPVAKGKKLNLVEIIDNEMPMSLIYDSAKIGQVLTNLLNNSIKFTQKGGVFVLAEWKEVSSERELVDGVLLKRLLAESFREKVIKAFEGTAFCG